MGHKASRLHRKFIACAEGNTKHYESKLYSPKISCGSRDKTHTQLENRLFGKECSRVPGSPLVSSGQWIPVL